MRQLLKNSKPQDKLSVNTSFSFVGSIAEVKGIIIFI